MIVPATVVGSRQPIDQAFGAHLANERRLVGLMPEADRDRLAMTLEFWGRALDE